MPRSSFFRKLHSRGSLKQYYSESTVGLFALGYIVQQMSPYEGIHPRLSCTIGTFHSGGCNLALLASIPRVSCRGWTPREELSTLPETTRQLH